MWSLFLLTSCLITAPTPERPAPPFAPAAVRAAAQRSIDFLQTDAEKWHKKAQCASCHQGAMTVVALSEARKQGFTIDEKSLADNLAWTKARFVPLYERQPHLTDGFDIPSLAIPLLTLALPSNPSVLTQDEIDRMTQYVVDRQQPDGGWVLQPRPPAPVFDSRETLTTWFFLGLEAGVPNDSESPSSARTSRELAVKWLNSRPPADSTQYWAMRLLMSVHSHASSRERRRLVNELLHRQNPNGGWAQTPQLASDAYATGQALYVLSLAGLRSNREEIRRGVEFLVTTQLEDGSWKMIPRATPERQASLNLWPINYFGAAWATMGLVRSVPSPK